MHRALEGCAVGFVECAVGALQDGGAFPLRAGAEAVDVAHDFDLLAQRQALDSADDGFEDRHRAARKAVNGEECEGDQRGLSESNGGRLQAQAARQAGSTLNGATLNGAT